MQVNLLDDFGKPNETNVTVNIFDQHSEQLELGFVHTLNHKGNPDTISLDPSRTYRVEAHTIPTLELEDVNITAGTHNIIALDAGQGDLELKIDGQLGEDVAVILRKAGDLNTAHIMESNVKERVLTDTYDMEVLSTPRTYINGVVVNQTKQPQ